MRPDHGYGYADTGGIEPRETALEPRGSVTLDRTPDDAAQRAHAQWCAENAEYLRPHEEAWQRELTKAPIEPEKEYAPYRRPAVEHAAHARWSAAWRRELAAKYRATGAWELARILDQEAEEFEMSHEAWLIEAVRELETEIMAEMLGAKDAPVALAPARIEDRVARSRERARLTRRWAEVVDATSLPGADPSHLWIEAARLEAKADEIERNYFLEPQR
jgi:hypothetical protein